MLAVVERFSSRDTALTPPRVNRNIHPFDLSDSHITISCSLRNLTFFLLTTHRLQLTHSLSLYLQNHTLSQTFVPHILIPPANMDQLKGAFNSFSGGNNSTNTNQGQNESIPQQSGSGSGGGGGFLGGIGDKLNSAAGGGRESEKNEDYLDKGKVPPIPCRTTSPRHCVTPSVES